MFKRSYCVGYNFIQALVTPEFCIYIVFSLELEVPYIFPHMVSKNSTTTSL